MELFFTNINKRTYNKELYNVPLGYPHLHKGEVHIYCNEWEVYTFLSIDAVSDKKH